MTDIENALRDELRRTATGNHQNSARLEQVRTRVKRNQSRRRAATAVVSVAVVVALGGATANLRDPFDRKPSAVATEATEAIDAEQAVVAELLSGAVVPDDFDPVPLTPLGSLFSRDRVQSVTGVAEAVACAWTSRYATAPRSPAAQEAREALNLSADWSLLQAIAADNDYPSRVSTIAADILRDELRPDWRSYLRCDGFPGNTNVSQDSPTDANPAR